MPFRCVHAVQAVTRTCSLEKVFLNISPGKDMYQSLFLIKLQADADVFSCEFCETPFLTEHLWWLLLIL